MTITAALPSYIQLPGNGSATVFAFPFKIFAATDLLVGFIVAGAYTAQPGGFTVQNVDVNGGGSITFAVPPPTGTLVDIRTQTPQTQPTEFANLGAYLPENTTEACDRLTRALQDVFRRTYTFGIHGPDNESTPWSALPAAAQRANTNLGFDNNGLPAVNLQLLGATLSTSTLAPFLGLEQTAAESAAGVTPTFLFYPPGNVLRYGAKGDGSTDDSVAIQNAINVMQILCGSAYLPATTASYKVTVPLNVTAGVSIVGDGFSPYTPTDAGTRGPGSWLQFAHLGKGFNINNGAGDVTSVFLQKIATLRNQAAPGVGWAPLATDYDIFVGDGDVHIKDVMLWNPSYGVQINSASGARLFIDNLMGQPLIVGIDCFLAEDVVRISNVHFWPWWENDNTYINAYTRLNLVPLQLERCDNPIISNLFCIYAYNGIVFTSNVNGFTQRAQLSNIDIDTYTENAITVLAGANGASFTVNGLEGYAGSGNCNGISCYANNCYIQALGVRFSLLGFCASSINGTGNVAKYTNWIVDGYNGANNGSECFYTNAGCRTDISDRVQATATNAAPLLNGILNNYGAIAAEGNWSITAGTSVVITHGLGWTPASYQIALQTGNSAAGSSLWVDTITSTQFTVHASSSTTVAGNYTIDGRTP